MPFAAALHGSLRWADAGDRGDVRQPAVPERRGDVFRRLIRSLPTRHGVIGVATCDKGLPAMMMALAGMHDLPARLVPGGVTLPAGGRRRRGEGADDRSAVVARARDAGRGGGDGLPRLRVAGRRMPVPRYGGDVAGGWRGVGHVAGHSALAPTGHPIWFDMARRSARAIWH